MGAHDDRYFIERIAELAELTDNMERRIKKLEDEKEKQKATLEFIEFMPAGILLTVIAVSIAILSVCLLIKMLHSW